MPDAANARVYTQWLQLGNARVVTGIPATLAPVQTSLAPGHDTRWEILRVWALAIGYDSQSSSGTSEPGPQLGTNYDPYAATRDVNAGAGTVPLIYNPTAVIFKNRIAPDAIIQNFNYVPRSFSPIALGQPTVILPNEQVVFLAGELVTLSRTAGDRTRQGRGITFGIEVVETVHV